ncbi:hypothetical protein [Stenotrophomonas sp.]|uniref:hypothetical protein n=1 Tax=Stenotrophomonas sp. TaxID=69392 RepID=UPI0028A5D965|nr:hypothetical protein [Stenotrophomonas sp.]
MEGFRLPGSYCEFAATLGYGRFGGLAIIYSGVPAHPDSILVQGTRVKGFIKDAVDDDYFEFEPDGDDAIAGRLYPFAASENGEYFVWDVLALEWRVFGMRQSHWTNCLRSFVVDPSRM